jgi:predicted metal-dependent peptidase
MSRKNIYNEVSRCIIEMLINEPFYAHFLSGIVRDITTDIPTAAVGLNSTKVTLFINEKFFLQELTTFSSRVAVIKHETLHILFKHLFRFDKKKYDSKLFNIAADLVVNQFIGKWKLPTNAITLSSFQDLDLVKNESVEYYYKQIFDLKKQIDKNNRTNSSPSEQNNNAEDSFPTESAKTLQEILKNGTHSDHSKWGWAEDNLKSSHAETELDRLIVQAKERTSINDYHLLPIEIKDSIGLIIEKRNPKVNWKRALKIFTSSSRKTRVRFTSKRVSKRYGTRPGLKIQRNQKIAVAVDTSGSISEDNLKLFFNEIHSIWRNGAEIEVIECDSKVQQTYNYKGKFPDIIHGRGWTDFNPVFDYINRDKSNIYDGCIYLTDGEANAPQIKPKCNVFWVITSDGKIGSHLKFGRVVQMIN